VGGEKGADKKKIGNIQKGGAPLAFGEGAPRGARGCGLPRPVGQGDWGFQKMRGKLGWGAKKGGFYFFCLSFRGSDFSPHWKKNPLGV